MININGIGFGDGPGMFGLVSALFPLVFIAILAFIAFTLVKSILQWNHNNKQTILTVEARVATKRTAVSHHHSASNESMHSHSTDTSYFVTFEVESGDRIEFRISGSEYGQLVEGDMGKLNFQGTRYLGFARHRVVSYP
ncbi:DUF2500 domain-containing protein [Paenibacillus sp. GbtcB18]|uniref:DUF2500 domain-containing protein n=1 Tax=Paenibacillus sp. GbtcB18 TaxID=2824763 RepID=UPI001C2F5F61|nr:DUF2500 domain-containing protein [Paenibacillus sp. GbtcB18]